MVKKDSKKTPKKITINDLEKQNDSLKYKILTSKPMMSVIVALGKLNKSSKKKETAKKQRESIQLEFLKKREETTKNKQKTTYEDTLKKSTVMFDKLINDDEINKLLRKSI